MKKPHLPLSLRHGPGVVPGAKFFGKEGGEYGYYNTLRKLANK